MNKKNVLLIVVGGLIGLASSLVTVVVTHELEQVRLTEQLERENTLRQEERRREDLLRQEEREREDTLRKEEFARERERLLAQMTRENQRRRQDIRIDALRREAAALWGDIERTQDAIEALPETDAFHRDFLLGQLERLLEVRRNILAELKRLEDSI